MKQILAIAVLGIRTAIRAKLIIGLILLLLITMITLPLSVQGDGTLSGYLRILVEYSFGAAFWILAITSLWAGCGAVAHDIDTKVLHLVVTKPVSSFTLWTGKWLGLVILNGVLLLLCGAAIYGILQWKVRSGEPETQQTDFIALEADDTDVATTNQLNDVLMSRALVKPAQPDIREEAVSFYEQQMKRGLVPEGITAETAMTEIERGLLIRANTIAPGAAKTWTFTIGDTVLTNRSTILSYTIASSSLALDDIDGQWQFERESDGATFSASSSATANTKSMIDLPEQWIYPGDTIRVTYANSSDPAVTVVFRADDGLSLLVPAGHFETNLAKTLLMLLVQLGFLSAIGVTAGCFFSYPVAAFVSLFFLCIIQLAGFLDDLSHLDITAVWANGLSVSSLFTFFSVLSFHVMSFITQPFTMENPLSLLSTGIHITWLEVGTVFLLKIALYSGAMALLSMWILHRRELGLPRT